ncbi:hypothetical protein LTR64_000816 [Lithohypha guttulata]|uniref:uncharacterized protein n=1 Tax=Lithohypha guttulata TaxID=1690604 RepID=UPI002DDEF1C9|nr:hypothetical protein LTR51_005418 [Lithohypha guttulata]
MVDTRCVNPAYQLDVDVMAIEYVLYKAIEAQHHLLRSLYRIQRMSSTANDLHNVQDAAEAALRLVEIYDTLVKLFSNNHGLDKLSECTKLDADLLRFLTLFNIWLHQQIDGFEIAAPQVSSEMKFNLLCDQLINHFFRVRWLRTREGGASRGDLPSESGGSNQKSIPQNPQLCLAHHILPQFLHLCDHLLPFFMHLSHKIQPPEARLSEKWMELACSFMVQGAIEILDAPDLFKHGSDVAKVALEECFAWGYVVRNIYANNPALIQRISTQLQATIPEAIGDRTEDFTQRIRHVMSLEDDCWKMFYDDGTNGEGHDTLRSSRELSQWTTMRQDALDAVLATFAAMQDETESEAEAQARRPVQYLRKHYPLSKFLDEVANFLAISWQKLHRPDWHGKPVLVQIEEGSLQGLSSEQFEDLKLRARIHHEDCFEVP